MSLQDCLDVFTKEEKLGGDDRQVREGEPRVLCNMCRIDASVSVIGEGRGNALSVTNVVTAQYIALGAL